MRVYVTGGGGFVGQWLRRELETSGHEIVREAGAPRDRVDVRDARALATAIGDLRPEAVVHLAAVSSATEAAADPAAALDVTVAGTVHLMEAVRKLRISPNVLVVGSSEVYGAPAPDELPLTEASPLRPETVYATSKVAQESIGLSYAARYDWPLAVVRPFNHTGPGQRSAFVVPAIARRIVALSDGEAPDIPVGNVDVKRDFSDVRDVTRAYTLVLEALADDRVPRGGRVFNVSSGRSVSIRDIVETLCRAAGLEARIRVDPALVRSIDPPEIRGDARALQQVTGWVPQIPLEQTLHDVWHEVAGIRAQTAVHGGRCAERSPEARL